MRINIDGITFGSPDLVILEMSVHDRCYLSVMAIMMDWCWYHWDGIDDYLLWYWYLFLIYLNIASDDLSSLSMVRKHLSMILTYGDDLYGFINLIFILWMFFSLPTSDTWYCLSSMILIISNGPIHDGRNFLTFPICCRCISIIT